MTAENNIITINKINLTNFTKLTIIQNFEFRNLLINDFYKFFIMLSFN